MRPLRCQRAVAEADQRCRGRGRLPRFAAQQQRRDRQANGCFQADLGEAGPAVIPPALFNWRPSGADLPIRVGMRRSSSTTFPTRFAVNLGNRWAKTYNLLRHRVGQRRLRGRCDCEEAGGAQEHQLPLLELAAPANAAARKVGLLVFHGSLIVDRRPGRGQVHPTVIAHGWGAKGAAGAGRWDLYCRPIVG